MEILKASILFVTSPDSEVVRRSSLLALVSLMMQIENKVVGQRLVALLTSDSWSAATLTRLFVTNWRHGSTDVASTVVTTEQVTICRGGREEKGNTEEV